MKYIFFVLNVIVDISAHLIMFFLWRDFLGLNDIFIQMAVGAILLMFLSLTVIAPLLIYWRDNMLSRSLYLVVGLWLGFMLNTILLALLYYTIVYFFPFLALTYYIKGLYLIVLSVLILIPEAWAAQCWRIKRVTIKMNNLPDYWVDKEIVHISDIHLGPIWRQRFFDNLLKKIKDLKAEAIFITGDLFDGMEANFSWFHERKLDAPSGVYYSFGNHDMLLGKDRVKALLKNSNIIVLDNVLHEEKDLQIIGISCYYEGHLDMNKKLRVDIKHNPNKASILLYHEPKNVPEVKGLGISLQLSGHTHGGQMWPFGLIAKALYRGFVNGVYRLKDYTLIVSAGAGTWGPPLRLFSRSEIVLIKLIKA